MGWRIASPERVTVRSHDMCASVIWTRSGHRRRRRASQFKFKNSAEVPRLGPRCLGSLSAGHRVRRVYTTHTL